MRADGAGRGRALLAMALLAASLAGADRPAPEDDGTFRPTVVVRKGNGQGSGTVIASAADETLVLTACHVVDNPGPLLVELHRYNLGVEDRSLPGPWPRRVRAEVAARDADADVAIVRIRGMVALPYVARLAGDEDEPGAGSVVTSVGIDKGDHLSSWSTQVRGEAVFDRRRQGSDRLFLITDRAPEHGRSGGGLFRPDGTLVGLCVGRIELSKGRVSGLFASGESIRVLLRAHDLDASIARSHAGEDDRPDRPSRRPRVTETRAREGR
jgi:S1-C subfamily serine protease